MAYVGVIRADYQTIYTATFPLAVILAPPIGWRVVQVREWRRTCPDHCWRVLLNQEKAHV